MTQNDLQGSKKHESFLRFEFVMNKISLLRCNQSEIVWLLCLAQIIYTVRIGLSCVFYMRMPVHAHGHTSRKKTHTGTQAEKKTRV